MLELNQIYNMDCMEGLKLIDDNSIDSIVTDPPYELGFMGKKWDNTGIAYNVELWKQALRVLKPGGYLLAFGGTRTYHRMACAIEDAGFEIRDQIQWLYGSGFPKSLNIGKAVDKLQGNEREVVGHSIYEGRRPNNFGGNKNGDICYGDYKAQPEMLIDKGASEWEGWGTALKPANEVIAVARKPLTTVPFCDILNVVIKTMGGILCQLPSFVRIAGKSLKSNPKELKGDAATAQWIVGENTNIQESLNVLMDILLFASTENTNWNIVLSWLNTLNDLYEMANRFTTSTEIALTIELKILQSLTWQDIFQNIIQAPNNNIDGLSVNVLTVESLFNAVNMKLDYIRIRSAQDNVIYRDELKNLHPNNEPICVARKPLSEKSVAENVLKWGTGGINIDGCRVGLRKENESGWSKTGSKASENRSMSGANYERKAKSEAGMGRFPANIILDEEAGELLGEPSRFFYCAKASKSERNEGLENNVTQKVNDGRQTPIDNAFQRGETLRKNIHPTVKPIKLIEYLVKLVTPKGGVSLDLFEGSGTHALACINLGFNYIGFELEEDYMTISKGRIEAHKAQLRLEI